MAKIIFIGVLIAILIYLFHPGVGQMSLIINGEPVAEPLVPFAALTTVLLVLGITAVLGLLMFFGVGLFIFIGALFFALFGIVLMAPYFWPVLAIIFVVIGLMSIGRR
jgi:hypothetical protein